MNSMCITGQLITSTPPDTTPPPSCLSTTMGMDTTSTTALMATTSTLCTLDKREAVAAEQLYSYVFAAAAFALSGTASTQESVKGEAAVKAPSTRVSMRRLLLRKLSSNIMTTLTHHLLPSLSSKWGTDSLACTLLLQGNQACILLQGNQECTLLLLGNHRCIHQDKCHLQVCNQCTNEQKLRESRLL